MFKDFYSALVPVVVCGGKTDTIYLLHAIRSLAVGYPKLATVSASNQFSLNIRIREAGEIDFRGVFSDILRQNMLTEIQRWIGLAVWMECSFRGG